MRAIKLAIKDLSEHIFLIILYTVVFSFSLILAVGLIRDVELKKGSFMFEYNCNKSSIMFVESKPFVYGLNVKDVLTINKKNFCEIVFSDQYDSGSFYYLEDMNSIRIEGLNAKEEYRRVIVLIGNYANLLGFDYSKDEKVKVFGYYNEDKNIQIGTYNGTINLVEQYLDFYHPKYYKQQTPFYKESLYLCVSDYDTLASLQIPIGDLTRYLNVRVTNKEVENEIKELSLAYCGSLVTFYKASDSSNNALSNIGVWSFALLTFVNTVIVLILTLNKIIDKKMKEYCVTYLAGASKGEISLRIVVFILCYCFIISSYGLFTLFKVRQYMYLYLPFILLALIIVFTCVFSYLKVNRIQKEFASYLRNE